MSCFQTTINVLLSMVDPSALQKWILGQKTAFLASKRALLGNQGPKTARQAAKWAPIGKPKVSKVASGYGEVMIP